MRLAKLLIASGISVSSTRIKISSSKCNICVTTLGICSKGLPLMSNLRNLGKFNSSMGSVLKLLPETFCRKRLSTSASPSIFFPKIKLSSFDNSPISAGNSDRSFPDRSSSVQPSRSACAIIANNSASVINSRKK